MIISQEMLTIQGEGKYLGYPSVFIRLLGCNLKCYYCDTKWSLNKNNALYEYNDKHDIINYANVIHNTYFKNTCPNIVFTGGEPLIYIEDIYNFSSKLVELNAEINQSKLTFDIETNGVLINHEVLENIIELRKISNINLNISPKLHVECYNKPIEKFDDIIDRFKLINTILAKYNGAIEYCYKFIHKIEDEENILRFIQKNKIENKKIYCMSYTPMNLDDNEFQQVFHDNNIKTGEFCIKHGFIYSPRQHIYLFGRKKTEFNQ